MQKGGLKALIGALYCKNVARKQRMGCEEEGERARARQRGLLDRRPGGEKFPHACQTLSKFRIDGAHRQHC